LDISEMTPEDLEFFTRTASEARGMTPRPYPGFLSRAVNHPGILTHETKTPEEYEGDQRRAYVLRRLSEQYKDNLPYITRNFPPGVADAVREYRDAPELIEGAYNKRGVLAPGQPVANALTWLGSATSAVDNFGPKQLANLADRAVSAAYGQESHDPYPEANSDFQRDINTFGLQVPEMIGLTRPGSHMDTIASGRAQRAGKSWEFLDPEIRRLSDAYTDQQTMDGVRLSDNVETLRQAGAPEWVAGTAGTIFNAATDPFGPGNFLKARHLPWRQAAAMMATDFGPEPVLRYTPAVLGGLLGEEE